MLLFLGKRNIDSEICFLHIEEINLTQKSLILVRKVWEEV